MSHRSLRQIEPPDELARLREDLVAFYRPANSQERLAVERIAMAQQSMLRAARLEHSLFAEPPGVELHSLLETDAFKMFLRYQAQAERLYRRAVEELMALRARHPQLPEVPARNLKPHVVVPAAAVSSPPAVSPPVVPAGPAAVPAAARAFSGNLALRL